jgi:hypothetical protein
MAGDAINCRLILELAEASPNTTTVDRLVNIDWPLRGVLFFRVPGDVVELGCFQGHTSVLLQDILVAEGARRDLHLYDSFEGLPECQAGFRYLSDRGGGPDRTVAGIGHGPVGMRVLRGMHRAFAAIAEAGNNEIIDGVYVDAEVVLDLLDVLAPFDVVLVGVRCDLEIGGARARAGRAGRPGPQPGGVRPPALVIRPRVRHQLA